MLIIIGGFALSALTLFLALIIDRLVEIHVIDEIPLHIISFPALVAWRVFAIVTTLWIVLGIMAMAWKAATGQ